MVLPQQCSLNSTTLPEKAKPYLLKSTSYVNLMGVAIYSNIWMTDKRHNNILIKLINTRILVPKKEEAKGIEASYFGATQNI